MSFWSDIVRDHVTLIRRTVPEDLVQEMLRESGISFLENGECDADSLACLCSYLNVVETYLGTLYRERAEADFTQVINQGWVQMDESAKLAGTLQLEVEKQGEVARYLLERTQSLEEQKVHAEATVLAKGQFFANVSHKIKTPLSSILGSATLLQECGLNERQRELCDIVLQSVDSLTHTVNDIVDYMEIDAGRFKLLPKAFDLYEMMSGIEKLLKPLAEDKGLHFSIAIEKHLPRIVVGDSARIQQVLVNLIKNGLKFTESGGIKILLGKDAITSKRFNIIYEIEDTGIGLSKMELKKISRTLLERGFSEARRSGGLGLGLTTCRNLVQLMGGQIDLDSELHQGTVFTVTIPMDTASENVVNRSTLFEDDKRDYQQRVLLAEDNVVDRKVIEKMLLNLGIEVTVAKNGQEALDLCMDKPFDLILLDMQMPIRDGVEVTRHIRALDDLERSGTPILALTAEWGAQEHERFIDAGADGIISKPLRLKWLIREMDKWFYGKGFCAVP